MLLKINWKKLIFCLAIPLAVGGLSAFVTSGYMDLYKTVKQPPFAPPSWVFPVVWSILYILMGISLYLVCIERTRQSKATAYAVFALQLFLNFIWSPIFFISKAFLAAFVVLVLLWIAVLAMIFSFKKLNKVSGYLQIPYIVWVTIAGYLNIGIYLLNR